MNREIEQKLADTISHDIVNALWNHPNIDGFKGLGLRGTHDLESHPYCWLLDHANLVEEK